MDDNRDAADSMATLLGLAGYTTRCAYDGPSALHVAEAFSPEVVLLDLGLPGLTGFEVAQRLRSRPLGQRLKLVAMTGYGQAEDRQKTQAAGFDHHLVKPVEFSALMQLLAQERAAPK